MKHQIRYLIKRHQAQAKKINDLENRVLDLEELLYNQVRIVDELKNKKK